MIIPSNTVRAGYSEILLDLIRKYNIKDFVRNLNERPMSLNAYKYLLYFLRFNEFRVIMGTIKFYNLS